MVRVIPGRGDMGARETFEFPESHKWLCQCVCKAQNVRKDGPEEGLDHEGPVCQNKELTF